MTELEILERAKMYMEKLANGVNPIDGSAIPDEEIVNNVRVSRCFFYVAGVLQQVIDNGGVTPRKKPKKIAFALSEAQRNAFEFSAKPIPISELSKRINSLVDDENMSTLGYTVLRNWLMSLGMLKETQDGAGKTVKWPTELGEGIGITLDARSGANGPYFVVVYNLEAQHFIIDNLDAILEWEDAKRENQGQAWNPEHDRCLLDLHQKGVPVSEIAITLKRNPGAIRSRLKKLGMV